ncbi:hypothetical protein [Shewanella surugensis]|uniref:Cytochrome C n=1 Tax=Shewanella surugensis TaxID=212020 RepID=A0ABT0LFS9_9GAMM|nr:hypothetical protein [Shewanella surugensis]MCL1126414.1 hypothetical protein [Shewanella surugensis]
MNKIILYLAIAIIVISILSLIFSPQNSTPSETASHYPCQFPTQAPHPDATQTDFNQFSWRLFIALNWPVKSQLRGQPDCRFSLDDKQQSVWQSYKNINDIFIEQGQIPSPWNQTQNETPLSQLTKVTNQASNLAELQKIGGWVIDQQGNPTYYEILVNQISFDYIVKNKLYDYNTLIDKDNINFPDSSTQIKASWRILNPPQDEISRYITKQANIRLFDQQGQAKNQTTNAILGLVGLHIITKASGYPQWIWSTFEHRNNVPIQMMENNSLVNQPQTGINYHYYDANARASDVNQSPCLWMERPTINGMKSNNDTKKSPLICQPKSNISFQTPTPLERYTPINEMTKEVNQYQQENTPVQYTVLENYQLIATQYPTQPDHPSDPLGQPNPKLAANITMESYVQASSSCIGCHSQASAPNSQYPSDYSYLFLSVNIPTPKPTAQ